MKYTLNYPHKKFFYHRFLAAISGSAAILMLAAFLIITPVDIASARQESIAVFPVEDLSRGINSTNFEITRYLYEEMAARGLSIALEDDIISFMASERVRWLSYLDTDRLLLLQKKLGVDLVLFGTISQRDAKNSPTFGLSLSLVRTRDGKTIWTNTGGLSLADMQHMLGLNEPATLDELWPILVKKVLSEWPADMDERVNQALIFDSEAGERPPTLQIKKMNLTPRYVRPGEQVKCIVQLDTDEEQYDSPQIFIKVGNRVHLAQQSTDGLFYEASWTGSEIEKGIFREVGHESLNLAATDLKPQFFEGVWAGAIEDDVYPVSLILRWPAGDQQLAFVGNYTVDSTPPDINLLIKGRKLKGLITFRDKIFILPTVKNREPFSHWQIRVEDETGKVVMGDEGKGSLPRKLHWRGQGFNGFPVQEGIYRLRLKGWDRAGNEVETLEEVAYRPHPPDLTLEVEKASNALQIIVDSQDKEIPLQYWMLEVWNETGELLKSADGNELPAHFTIPFEWDAEDNSKIEGRVVLRDVLGNKTQVDIDDLYLLALRKTGTQEEETSDAPNEDDDSWAWLSEK